MGQRVPGLVEIPKLIGSPGLIWSPRCRVWGHVGYGKQAGETGRGRYMQEDKQKTNMSKQPKNKSNNSPYSTVNE